MVLDFSTPEEVCDDSRDPDALMRAALADYQLFKCGVLVSDEGRQLVVNLICMGYGRGTAMRIALGIEAAR